MLLQLDGAMWPCTFCLPSPEAFCLPAYGGRRCHAPSHGRGKKGPTYSHPRHLMTCMHKSWHAGQIRATHCTATAPQSCTAPLLRLPPTLAHMLPPLRCRRQGATALLQRLEAAPGSCGHRCVCTAGFGLVALA